MSESGIDHSLKRFKQVLFIFINLYSLQHIFYWARVYSQRQHSQTCPFETGHTFISETVKTSQSLSQNPAGGSPLCSVGPKAKSTDSGLSVSVAKGSQIVSSFDQKELFSLSPCPAGLLKLSPGECVCLSSCASVPVWCSTLRSEWLQSQLTALLL